MLTRDSFLLWVGMLGGFAGVIASNLGIFPAKYQAAIGSVCTLVMAISAWLKSSPLAGNKTDPARVESALGGLVSLTKKEGS